MVMTIRTFVIIMRVSLSNALSKFTISRYNGDCSSKDCLIMLMIRCEFKQCKNSGIKFFSLFIFDTFYGSAVLFEMNHVLMSFPFVYQNLHFSKQFICDSMCISYSLHYFYIFWKKKTKKSYDRRWKSAADLTYILIYERRNIFQEKPSC